MTYIRMVKEKNAKSLQLLTRSNQNSLTLLLLCNDGGTAAGRNPWGQRRFCLKTSTQSDILLEDRNTAETRNRYYILIAVLATVIKISPFLTDNMLL